MPRDERFTFLCNNDERHLIAELAHKLQRSQSDAVRIVIVAAALSLPVPLTVTSGFNQDNYVKVHGNSLELKIVEGGG